MANEKTVKLKNYSDVFEEMTATAVAITPGMLLEVATATTVQAHSTAGGSVLPMFAIENALEGQDMDENYVASNKIQVFIPGRGDQVYAILADDNSVVPGDFLESNGAGYLQKYADDSTAVDVISNRIVGVALETLDLTGDSSAESSASPIGVNKRIKVRII